MKKYLMMGVASLAIASAFVSCSKEKDLYDPTTNSKNFLEQYKKAFQEVFGEVAENQTWGFGATSRATRSFDAPAVLDIQAPYNETWVADYLQTAKEPTAANVSDNYNNCYYERKAGTYSDPYYTWYTEFEAAYPTADYGWDWSKAVEAAKKAGWEHWDDLFSYVEDETFVLNFKITGTWNGGISVAATEGLTDGQPNGFERTVVVTGTWNITEDQKIGSLGKIVIANGGTVNVAEGKTLNMVNQARLVVLPGGKLTGAGKVEVNNGNAVGEENYNGGTIDVAVFNNNFGKFYNYGDFLVNEYQGGAAESNFYNHHLAAIDHFGTYDSSTANARIFNGCQFYVKNDARIRNYEGVNGSALIVGGQLMFSSSEDGTNDPTYVGLAAGALVKCATLYNNGTSWAGPTEGGYAALEITNEIVFLNWEQDAPQTGGYFANNIYVKSATWNNVPGGNGYQQKDPSDEYNHSLSIAEYKFKNIVANCTGNGNVTIVEDGDEVYIPADSDFKLGEAGCTPGFKMKQPSIQPELPSLHVMAEDLAATQASDFDFNDISIDVFYVDANNVDIVLQAAGGTMPLRFCENDEWEVHKLFDLYQNDIYVQDENGQWIVNPAIRIMVNTGTKYHVAKAPFGQTEFLPYVTRRYSGFNGWSTDQDEFAAQVKENIKLEVSFGCLEDGTPVWTELTCGDNYTAKIATPTNARYYGEGGTPTDIKADAWYVWDGTPVNPKNYYWAWEKQFVGETFRKWVKTGEPFYYLVND